MARNAWRTDITMTTECISKMASYRSERRNPLLSLEQMLAEKTTLRTQKVTHRNIICKFCSDEYVMLRDYCISKYDLSWFTNGCNLQVTQLPVFLLFDLRVGFATTGEVVGLIR